MGTRGGKGTKGGADHGVVVGTRADQIDRLWSGIGAAVAALGPLMSGLLFEHFWWGPVFLITLPLAVVALILAPRLVPAHVNEATRPMDNLGGSSRR